MAEVGRFFDGVLYSEGDQAEVQARMVPDQVYVGVGGQLAVSSGGAGFASVASGEAFVQGFWYKNTASKVLAITGNASVTARIDMVVLKVDRINNTLTAVIKDGVVGTGAPALTQIVGGVWEFPIAQISTASNVSTFTDMRTMYRITFNPMTTADDIIKGGSTGDPQRLAKGANNTVFGVNAAGVLGYYPVGSAFVTDGSLVNADLAAQTIRGGVDGATSRIAPGSLNGVDLAAASALSVASVAASNTGIFGGVLTASAGMSVLNDITLTRQAASSPTSGALFFGNTGTRYLYYDGTNFQVSGPLNVGNFSVTGTLGLPAGSITQGFIANRAITASTTFQQYSNGTVFGAGAWAYIGGGIGIGGIIGQTLVLNIVSITLQANTVGAIINVGIGVDTTGSATWSTAASMPIANTLVQMTVVALHTLSAASHGYYPLILTNAGTINTYSIIQFSTTVFHK